MPLSRYIDMWPNPDGDDHEYRAPGPNDLRSPCPYLNIMANHGYIHRSGQHITWWAAARGMMELYNFSLGLALFVATAGVFTSFCLAWNPFWFDLKQQRAHKPYLVEHDASVSRKDYPLNNWQGDENIVNDLLAQSSSDSGDLSYKDIAHHRVARESLLPAPLTYPRHWLATGEIGLIVPALGRGPLPITSPEESINGTIAHDWVKTIFLNERLPQGWKRPDHVITLSEVNSVASKVRDEMQRYRQAKKFQ